MRPALLRTALPAALAALALGVSACGDDGDSAGGEGGEGERGGKLTVLSSGDVAGLDPGAAYDQFSYMVTNATQRPLYSYKPDDVEKPTPDLAQGDPRISDGGKTVTARIKSGIRFSPPVRREVTSKDVKYAIERGFTESVGNGYAATYFADLEGAPAEPGDHEEIEGIETPDDRTIVFKLTRPTGGVLAGALALPLSAPVPPEYAKKLDRKSPSGYGRRQVFTGPYMIRSDRSGRLTGYEPNKRIELVRNPSWDRDTDFRPALLDEIEIREGNDDTTAAGRRILRGKGMISGDFSPPPPVLKQALQGGTKDQLELAPSGGNQYVSLNTKVKPFDDENIRKAVIAGMDRNALRLTRGGEVIGYVATHFIPPEVPGFEEAGGAKGPALDFLGKPEGNPNVAAEYFEKAGFPSGKYEGDEDLLVVGDDDAPGDKTADVVAEQLRKLGFKVTLRKVPHETMLTKFCEVPEREVAVCPNAGWLKDFNDGQTMLDPIFNGEAIQDTANTNWSQLDDPEVNEAMAKASELVDPATRAKAWGDIDRLVTSKAAFVPYVWDKQGNVRSDDVRGVINRATAGWDLAFTSLR